MAKALLAGPQRRLALLQLGDLAAHHDGAAVGESLVADAMPPPVAAGHLLQAVAAPEVGEAPREPLLLAPEGVHVAAPLAAGT